MANATPPEIVPKAGYRTLQPGRTARGSTSNGKGTDLDLPSVRRLALDAATLFVLTPDGRIVRENDPEHSAGPLVFFAGCAEGNIALVRQDVDERLAKAILERLGAAPPWIDVAEPPPGIGTICEDLRATTAVKAVTTSIIYALPNGGAAVADAAFACHDDAAGAALVARLERDGMPEALTAAGFLSLDDFWAPWCVRLEGDEIAAIAIAARLGEAAAEIGVYTFPGFRGRGLAAALTARWSSLAALGGKTLFYSALTPNRSSHRVAERLGLRPIGLGLRVA